MTGDGTRITGPFREDDTLREFGGYFQSVNRNRRSIAVDLKTEAGREIVRKLINHADIVVENFRAGVMRNAWCGRHSLAPTMVRNREKFDLLV
ncbi:hypothetical protein AU476_17935 [Cupriavidus sp. UYMSc13B]|nr:hypothetical protein AU476_17935 [Cupriavidus sp. UYMSc13B]